MLHTRSVVSEKESNGNIDWDEWIFIETKRRYVATKSPTSSITHTNDP